VSEEATDALDSGAAASAVRAEAPAGAPAMTRDRDRPDILTGRTAHDDARRDGEAPLDARTTALVRLSAVLAAGSEAEMRRALQASLGVLPHAWVEELLLQTYLFAGIPRALNAAREWRRASGAAAPRADEGEDYSRADEWRARGEQTCAEVYGPFYERLRHNIRELHPALDAWMIVEGYGKVLSRDALDIRRRELCVVATCAALRQDRQLHSHLHGALHVGATADEVGAVLAAVAHLVPPEDMRGMEMLWIRVRDAHVRASPGAGRTAQPVQPVTGSH
jgi:4-carboxymuconolactone decarboxylase